MVSTEDRKNPSDQIVEIHQTHNKHTRKHILVYKTTLVRHQINIFNNLASKKLGGKAAAIVEFQIETALMMKKQASFEKSMASYSQCSQFQPLSPHLQSQVMDIDNGYKITN